MPRIQAGSVSIKRRAMSAFPESGRSDRWKLGQIKVRFRPEADIQVSLCAPAGTNHLLSRDNKPRREIATKEYSQVGYEIILVSTFP